MSFDRRQMRQLRLDAARGPVEVVVIDRIEKPTFD
jgi:hypothetical protein